MSGGGSEDRDAGAPTPEEREARLRELLGTPMLAFGVLDGELIMLEGAGLVHASPAQRAHILSCIHAAVVCELGALVGEGDGGGEGGGAVVH